jgi:glycolate oxidase FAD binding subunit
VVTAGSTSAPPPWVIPTGELPFVPRAGEQPWVVAPTSAQEVAEVFRTAAAREWTVVARGAGTKSHWGGVSSTVDVVVETWRLRGVRMHEPGDLVATVGAGTPLDDLRGVLGLAGQRLSLESGSPGATVGGVLAAGEAGPLRLRHGAGRDLLIGVEFVRPDGVVAHSGGRVVKNVAGYDLGKLLCGSYGTLGIITSATFRLHPVPAARAWVTHRIRSTAELTDLVARSLDPRVNASAVEVDLTGGAGTLAVLVEGSTAAVPVRAAAAVELLGDGAVIGPQPRWWGQYPFLFDAIALKLAAPLRRLGAVVDALTEAAGPEVAVRGSAGVGVVHASLPGATTTTKMEFVLRAVRGVLAPDDGVPAGSCVVLAAPDSIRSAVDVWGPVPGLALMRRLKEQFDPDRRLASGRFVGGI